MCEIFAIILTIFVDRTRIGINCGDVIVLQCEIGKVGNRDIISLIELHIPTQIS